MFNAQMGQQYFDMGAMFHPVTECLRQYCPIKKDTTIALAFNLMSDIGIGFAGNVNKSLTG
jgi:hypothetical protein